MRKVQSVFLSTTAVGLVLGASAALASDPALIVGAPAPGQVHQVLGNETAGDVTVGDTSGNIGTLTIGAGQTLTSGLSTQVSTVIGRDAGASGTVLIEGGGAWVDGSGWSLLGDYGAGVLTLRNGGQMATGNFIIANHESGSGTVTLDGPGTIWINAYNVEIGRDGRGVVLVSGGAQVQNQTLKMGFGDGAGIGPSVTAGQGRLTVTGAGSTWTNGGGATLTGDATLLVDKGGSFETVQGGLYAKEGGTITVTGAGTSMKIGTLHSELPSDFNAADGWFSPDSGTILVSDGALLQADGSYIGGDGNVAANMTVTGAGTVFENSVGLYVGGTGNGDTGTGTLTIADGAQASAYTIAAGVDTGSTGTIRLTGRGSLLDAQFRTGFSGKIRAGFNGTGTILVQDGAIARTDALVSIAENSGSVGTLIIGAAEGDAAVAAGTIESVNGIAFGAGDATLVFNHTSQDYAFEHVLTGSGGVIRHLAGVTDLTGNSAGFDGEIDVVGGTLKANGDLGAATATVASGATLAGTGTIGEVAVQAGGVLAPGNSPGTLTIADGLTLAAGSVFDVEIDGTGHDQVYVEDGDVEIGAGAILRLTPKLGTTLNHDYTVIELASSSAGAVLKSGDGFAVDLSRPLLQSAVTYSSDDVTVRFSEVETPWSTQLGTPNQGTVADALQGLDANDPIRQAALYLDEPELRTALDQLTGEVHASVKTAQIVEGEFLRGTVFERLGTPEGSAAGPIEPQGYVAGPAAGVPFPGTAIAEAPPTAIWSQVYGGWGSSAANGNAAQINRQAGGLFIGADTRLDGWLVGLVGGYGQSAYSAADRSSSGTGTTFQVGGYAGTSLGAIEIRTGASYALNSVATRRTATLPMPQELKGSYDSGLVQAFGEIGYTFASGPVSLQPFAGVTLVNLSTDAYAETGGPAALHAAAARANLAFATLGVRGGYDLSIGDVNATASAMAGWRHAAGDTSSTAAHSLGQSGQFEVGGAPIASDALLVQLGLAMDLTETSTLDFSYDGELAADDHRQTLRGSLRTRF